ncbi:MAG: phage antirepressor KilAC domain-containing protein [Clostridia bacterium]|nr:phage antirepressor KilAC domain-containing protein [Clostridia bacterium]
MKNSNQIQQIHNDEFGSLDILMIDGKPYFPATECALVLGYKNPHKAIADHCRYLTKREVPHPQNREKQISRNFIPEGDLYRLIIRSKLPVAERFERWVFDEVLPTIRKHGAYATHDTLDDLLRSPKFAEKLIQQLDREREKYAALEGLATEMAPKADYCELVLYSKNLVPVSLIAKDYGMSAVRFNKLLHDLGIQYKAAGTWLLYQKHADKGYTKTRTYYTGDKTVAVHTCWTQKGRQFLYEFLKYYGILPVGEYPYGATFCA